MKYILIILAISGNGEHTAGLEFDTIDACKAAQEWVVSGDRVRGGSYSVKADCLPKADLAR